MDSTVPAGAAILLAFIRATETGRGDASAYDTVYAHKEGRLPRRLTSMTLGEIVDAQKAWSKNFGSSAAGAYQFMRITLIGLSKELGLRGDQIFDAAFQDRLGFHLLKRRGYEEFVAGRISRSELGKRLAQEWASFPVLAPTQGGSRKVTRGQSYYAGDGLNKALVKPEVVEALLDKVKAASAQPSLAPHPHAQPVEVPAPGEGRLPQPWLHHDGPDTSTLSPAAPSVMSRLLTSILSILKRIFKGA